MKIDGREIASEIYRELKIKIGKLNKQGIVPQIAVILIGDDPASISYVSQKKKWSKLIGIKFSLYSYPLNVKNNEILQLVKKLNEDPGIHGIIIQRPVPIQIDQKAITDVIDLQKDIDGFRSDSPYDAPVAKAVLKVLQKIYILSDKSETDFTNWLKEKSITVLGRGETAGGPIIKYLQKIGLNPVVLTSQTEMPEKILKTSDIIITAVGKSEVIKPLNLKQNTILIGVGMFKKKDGLLQGDYLVEDIKHSASYYTPVTGGIGPVNVAFLLENLVHSAETGNAWVK